MTNSEKTTFVRWLEKKRNDTICMSCPFNFMMCGKIGCSFNIMREIVEQEEVDAPTVYAVPVVHGHWIPDKNEILYGRICRCSVCGNYVVTDDIDITRTGLVAAAHNPFCRWCGAKMDKEDGEQE